MLTGNQICDTILNLVLLLLEDDNETRGCCGSGIIRNEKENKIDFTVEYNFSFRIIDNETGEEM